MIKYIDYDKSSLNSEINNYLYFLNYVCLDKKDVRRYVISILRLYEKIDSLPIDYDDEDINYYRTIRKSSRYINKIKKYVKKIKNANPSVFKEAADKLFEKNGQKMDTYKNRYSKENWDSEQISRTLTGDINGIIKRKRNDFLFSTVDVNNSSDTVYFDEYNEEINDNINEIIAENSVETNDLENSKETIADNSVEMKDISSERNDFLDASDAKDKHEEISFNNDLYLSDNSSNFIERTLIKKELLELKKEIDQNDDLFIDLDHISLEQRNVIKSYISICEKYNEINNLFHYIYENSSSNDIINIYQKIYEFTGFLISEMFEHIIHLSKVSCDIDEKSGLYEAKYLMDDSVLEVFGKYDLFIAKIQNFVKLLNEKQGANLLSSDKEMLSKILWDKYRLNDINPSSIKEAVSLDLMAFVNENPFTLVQTIPYSKKNTEAYKKYDLDKIMENVDYSLEKYIPELFKSMKKKIMNDSLLNDSDKDYAVSNIIVSFAKFIGEIHGISEFPIASHDYLLSYIMSKVFSVSSDLDGLLKECIQDIYADEKEKYMSLGFFDKILSKKGKPKTNLIESKIKSFTQEIDNISFSDE